MQCAHRSETNYYAMRTARYTTNTQLTPDWNITKTVCDKMQQNTTKQENNAISHKKIELILS